MVHKSSIYLVNRVGEISLKKAKFQRKIQLYTKFFTNPKIMFHITQILKKLLVKFLENIDSINSLLLTEMHRMLIQYRCKSHHRCRPTSAPVQSSSNKIGFCRIRTDQQPTANTQNELIQLKTQNNKFKVGSDISLLEGSSLYINLNSQDLQSQSQYLANTNSLPLLLRLQVCHPVAHSRAIQAMS